MTAIPDDWAEEVRSGDLSGPPPHDPLDWLGEECLRLDEELALTFDQGERLAAALAGARGEHLLTRTRARKPSIFARMC